MIQVSGNRVEISGALTLDTAAPVLQAGLDALTELAAQSQPAVFDFAAVSPVDSAALSVVFAWMRGAHAAKCHISLANPPQELLSLASVYGVSELLPLA